VSLDWIVRRLRETDDLVCVDEIRRAGREDASDSSANIGSPPASPSCVLHGNSWNEFASIGQQVAQALAHAHENGILHNDVKPANLLLMRNGQTIVTDFGIGRRRDDELGGADDAHQTGTVRYMAPERFLGGAKCEAMCIPSARRCTN